MLAFWLGQRCGHAHCFDHGCRARCRRRVNHEGWHRWKGMVW